MSGANHITGGTVFTAIFASFLNVNIFERPAFLFFTAFFSILADIDHIKSPIGKMFYPIAKYLDRNYGHRTITHSLIFYFGLILFVFVTESLITGGKGITLICCVSYFSHLLFDMLTKQGVPLFYPFVKNPCVIPANPELRFRSSDLKTESVIFAVFLVLGLSCQNLFAHGFWNSYNRIFSDLKHLNQDFNQTDKLLFVDYKFKNEFGKTINGKAYLIKSKETEATLYNNDFISLKSTDKIINLTPHRTTKKQAINEQIFVNIPIDSLLKLTQNKPILSLIYQSNKATTQQKYEYIKNPTLATQKDSNTIRLKQQLEIVNEEIKQEKIKINNENTKRYKIHERINFINATAHNLDHYSREKLTNELVKLKAIQHEPTTNNLSKLNLQANHLRQQIALEKNNLFSGVLTTLIITN